MHLYIQYTAQCGLVSKTCLFYFNKLLIHFGLYKILKNKLTWVSVLPSIKKVYIYIRAIRKNYFLNRNRQANVKMFNNLKQRLKHDFYPCSYNFASAILKPLGASVGVSSALLLATFLQWMKT